MQRKKEILFTAADALHPSTTAAGNRLGTVGGRAGSSTADKIFGILNSLGNIAFAFGAPAALPPAAPRGRAPAWGWPALLGSPGAAVRLFNNPRALVPPHPCRAAGFAQVLLEIQDTLRQPPLAEGTMRKASTVAVTAAFAFYFSSSVACYSALGNDVQGEVLEGFKREQWERGEGCGGGLTPASPVAAAAHHLAAAPLLALQRRLTGSSSSPTF